MNLALPSIYPLVDVDALGASALSRKRRAEIVIDFAQALTRAGAALLQLRAKALCDAELLPLALALRAALPTSVRLILNDRADLALAAACDGVHLGQQDLSPAAARRILGDDGIIGLSTHNPSQFAAALDEPVDYVALGPIFPTRSKADADPSVGLDGLKVCRSLIDSSARRGRPLVAIGGITLDNAALTRRSGADAIALISALRENPAKSFADFQRQML